VNTLLAMLGPDYATKAPPSLLMVKRTETHPTELTMLFRKRLVVAVESNEGARFNEALVKELTGGDRITARRMREDFWSFFPTHKVMLCTNHEPTIRGTDHAIWRRIRKVPFTVTIPDAEQDRELPAKLLEELPGILAWVVSGCLAWQSTSLEPPAEITSATKAYRDGQDVLGAFLEDECQEGSEVKASDLYARYKGWAERTGESAVNQRRFGQAMNERGYKRKENHGKWYVGLKLR
jgi:putative DNA primase/helicase